MQWIVLDETGSTTQAAREKLLTQPLPFAVLARRQTAGQGQWGRVWVHEAGNLAMTVAWPKAAVSEAMLPQVGYLVALAVRVAAGQGGVPLKFKWPNDVYYNGLKVGGILVEVAGEALLIGIGVNVATAPAVADRATACLAQAGYQGDAETLAQQIVTALEQGFAKARRLGFASVRSAWLADALFLGEPLTANGQTGRFLGLDGWGRVVLAASPLKYL